MNAYNGYELDALLDKYDFSNIPKEFEGIIEYEKLNDRSIEINTVIRGVDLDIINNLLLKYDWPIAIRIVGPLVSVVYGKLVNYLPDEAWNITEAYHHNTHPAELSFSFNENQRKWNKTESWYLNGCVLSSREVKNI